MTSTTPYQQLVDDREIRELRSKYAIHIDTGDWEGFGELLTEDVVGIYSSGRRDSYRIDGHDDVVAYTRENTPYEFSMHMALMPVIELDGDTAEGEWYMVHYHKLPDGTQGWYFGRYLDEYRRVDGQWKFSRIQVDVEDTYHSEPHDFGEHHGNSDE